MERIQELDTLTSASTIQSDHPSRGTRRHFALDSLPPRLSAEVVEHTALQASQKHLRKIRVVTVDDRHGQTITQ